MSLIPKHIIKLLKKKYPKRKSFTTMSPKEIQKALKRTKISTYAKKGGLIGKKV